MVSVTSEVISATVVTWGSEPSVFFELGGLTAGERVTVEREDATSAVFEVYGVERYEKSEFPPTRSIRTPRGPSCGS